MLKSKTSPATTVKRTPTKATGGVASNHQAVAAAEMSRVVSALKSGDHDGRIDATKFQGVEREMMESFGEVVEMFRQESAKSGDAKVRVTRVADRVGQLRDLCITNLGKAAEAMAQGDMKFEIVTGTPSFDVNGSDEVSQLEQSINDIITQTKATVASFMRGRETVLQVTEETKTLATAAQNGDIDHRATSSKFNGDFKELVEGVNNVLDVVGKRVTNVADRVEQLRGLCITNLGKATEAMAQGDMKFEIITGTPSFEVDSSTLR